jgi:hypothetical protein
MLSIDSKIVKVSLKDKEPSSEEEKVIITDVKLPDDAPARVKTLRAEGKKWYVTVTYYPGSERPFALFCTTNHYEKTAQTSDAVQRLISLARSKGILEEHIEHHLKKIEHETNVNKVTRTISLLLRHKVLIRNIVYELEMMNDIYVGSFLFQIKKFLSQYIKEGEKAEGVVCDSCKSHNVVFSEGCFMCRDCGNSKCG